MIVAIDVQYTNDKAFVACVAFDNWHAESPLKEYTTVVNHVEEYEPGAFYKRELPCILKVLSDHALKPVTIVVDGYVYLDAHQKPGLGKHVFDALHGESSVVGVAKKPFSDIGDEHAIYRGESIKPLYVTSTDSTQVAKQHILHMHGKHRIPTLLKRADQLCRELAKNSQNISEEFYI